MADAKSSPPNVAKPEAWSALVGKCRLISQEGDVFEVPKNVAVMSILVNEMVGTDDDNNDGDDNGDDPEIPLPNVKSVILTFVIDFCKHHVSNPMKEIEKPLKSAKMSDAVSEWDAKFVDNLTLEHLFELILAANYMDIKSLLDLTCAKVASMIKDKKPEEIRKTFGIVDDFTPEEIAQVRAENKWCEDPEDVNNEGLTSA